MKGSSLINDLTPENRDDTCSDNIKEGLKTHFVSESGKTSHSESKSLNSKELTKSKPENQKTKVMNDSKSKAPTLQILKRSKPNKQVLKKTESETQKPRFQRKELSLLSHILRLKVMNLKSGRRQNKTISDRKHK